MEVALCFFAPALLMSAAVALTVYSLTGGW